MGLSAAARDRALRAVVQAPLWMGLATHRREDGALVEEGDEAYRRRSASFEVVLVDGEPEARNTERIEFPPYERDARREVGFWFLSDAADGGNVQASEALALKRGGPLSPLAGEAPFFMPGDVVLRIGEDS